jgi:NAD(P)H-flavin reductase/ferredoxin
LIFNKGTFPPNQDETVLDCLLRHQVDVAYSCKSGTCQSCLLQSSHGSIDAAAQKGLKATAAEQGFFLACQQKAESIQQANFIDAELLYSHARVIDKQLFCDDICQLILEPVSPLFYHAGQFINLKNPQGIVRSYSIASLPKTNPFLELHIHRKNNGVMSQWIFDGLKIGDSVDFQGPLGECFYACSNPSNPLIMIGTGTGAAPLVGILEDALHSGHQGQIWFYHGARDYSGLYLHEKLSEIAHKYQNFNYRPCISSEVDSNLDLKMIKQGYCNEIALEELAVTEDSLLYLCGNPEMVKVTRKKAFLAGIASKNIYTDPFEYKDLRQSPR